MFFQPPDYQVVIFCVVTLRHGPHRLPLRIFVGKQLNPQKYEEKTLTPWRRPHTVRPLFLFQD